MKILLLILALSLSVLGQANLSFSGGSGIPLSITLQRAVTYTINNNQCAAGGPIFLFDGAGNPFSGSGPLVTGTITFSINMGPAQSITNANSGVAANDVTPNDIFVYGNLAGVSNGSTVVLSAGTVTTTNSIAAAPPASGTFPTFLTSNTGVRCSTDGVALGASAASVMVSGRVMTGRKGATNAVVKLTGADGATHQTLTDANGFYRFESVAAGETYILTASIKRFEFAPQVIYVTEELSGLNFTSQ